MTASIKKVYLIFFCILCPPIIFAGNVNISSSTVSDLPLKTCYNLALKNSLSVAIKEQLVNENKANKMKAIGSVLPHISFSATHTKQGLDNNLAEDKVVLSQPLFFGFKDRLTLDSIKI